MKPTSIADAVRSAQRIPLPTSVTHPAIKPDVTAAHIAAQPLATKNPLLGYILAASAKMHAGQKAGARHSAKDRKHIKQIAEHVEAIKDSLHALGLDNDANAGDADTAGKAGKQTFKAFGTR